MQIARAIARRRRREPFERTGDLVETIKAAIPAPARFGDGHPAKRVFQALRIAVNDELGALEAALPAAIEMLRPGGRVAVISFHSLEDRIVKHYLRELARGCTCPPDFPVCVCGHEPEVRILTPRPVRPSAREAALNPRSASARLRVGEKVRVSAAMAAVAPQSARRSSGPGSASRPAASEATPRAQAAGCERRRLDRDHRRPAGRHRVHERRRPAAEHPPRPARPGPDAAAGRRRRSSPRSSRAGRRGTDPGAGAWGGARPGTARPRPRISI